MRDPSAQSDLIEDLNANLNSLPQLRVDAPRREVEGSAGKADAEMTLQAGDKTYRLLIEIKHSAYPRDVQQIIWRRRATTAHQLLFQDSGEPIWMLVAESISPGAKELLKTEGIGYFDGGGSLYLPATGAYVYIDKPPAKSAAKRIGSLFSARRGQVLQALLQGYAEWFGTDELARAAQVSPATASLVLAELENLEWVETRGSGPHKQRRVRQAGTIVETWVKHVVGIRAPSFRKFFVPSLDANQPQETLGRVFENHQVTYAVSFEAAAQLYAPFLSQVSQVRCRLMSGPLSRAALTALDAREVTEGANLAVLDAKSQGEFLFRQYIDGVWLASPLQVYLDLQRSEGRAPELAQHLRRMKLAF